MKIIRRIKTAIRLTGLISRKLSNYLYSRKCKLCGSATNTEMTYNRLFYICKQCNFVFSSDEDDLSVTQGMGMMGSWSGPGGGGYREYYLVKMLMKDLGLKSFLLYGTGNTSTFETLMNEGVDVTGCDISKDVVEMKTQKYGPGRFVLPEDLSDKRYDAIIAVEVIEHFSRPYEEFSRLLSCLNDGGIICGTTDFYNKKSVLDSNNPGYMSYRAHVAYWNEQSLGFIATKYGLNVSTYELVRPGSVLPDEKFGQLWPNKRVFFIHPDQYSSYFAELYDKTPILPIDKP